MRDSKADYNNSSLALVILLQYIPRLFVIFPLNGRIIKTTGVVAKADWAGAGYNLVLFLLSSHVRNRAPPLFILLPVSETQLPFFFHLLLLLCLPQVLGATWYLVAVGRQFSCWKDRCNWENRHRALCLPYFLDCSTLEEPDRLNWRNVTTVIDDCDAVREAQIDFKFGIFAECFTDDVAASHFYRKILYCLWWGLRTLRSDFVIGFVDTISWTLIRNPPLKCFCLYQSSYFIYSLYSFFLQFICTGIRYKHICGGESTCYFHMYPWFGLVCTVDWQHAGTMNCHLKYY